MKLIKVDNDPEPSLINEKLSSVKLNAFILVLFLSTVVLTPSKQVHAQTSANFGITTNYLWRGISQSNNKFAASAGLDYAASSGFYVGTWASMLYSGSYELDLYSGFSTEVNAISYDAGVISFQYPNDNNYFNELYFSAAKAGFKAFLAYTFDSKDNDSAAYSRGDMYYSLAYSKALKSGLELAATIGRYDFNDAQGDDYKHLNLSASKYNFTLALDTTKSLASGNDTTLSLAWSKTINL